jgi:predicted kinase
VGQNRTVPAEPRSHVLLIGGRSGVGKSTVATALHELLTEAAVRHAVIEGDLLDLAHPAPHEDGLDLAERNLAAMWRNYRAFGYRRLVLTNTASVVARDSLVAAMGDRPLVTGVLLRASDETTTRRLSRRGLGAPIDSDRAHSERTAAWLDEEAGPDIARIDTDGRLPGDIAHELAVLTGWI